MSEHDIIAPCELRCAACSAFPTRRSEPCALNHAREGGAAASRSCCGTPGSWSRWWSCCAEALARLRTISQRSRPNSPSPWGRPTARTPAWCKSIAAQLAREQFNIRLQTKVLDGGPPAAAAAIDNGQADLAVVRRDAGMPKNGQAVAILRKNVVVFIVPSAAEPPKAAKDTAAAKGKTLRRARLMQRPSPLQRPRLQPRARLRRARLRPQTTRPKKPKIPQRSQKSIRWSASGSA